MPAAKPTSQQLLANYQTVMVSLATSETARYEATRSEHELVDHLRQASTGAYLQPTALQNDSPDSLSRASLDVHIKKVQAEQISAFSQQQLLALQEESQRAYVGKKVRITVRMPQQQPIETLWFDSRNSYRTSVNKKLQIKGIISEVLLDRNALVITPPAMARMLNSNLQQYIVYVIDPASGQPTVDISL